MRFKKEVQISSSIVIHSPSIKQSENDQVEQFMGDRFFVLSNRHNNAIIIGSSLAFQNQEIVTDQVLDAGGKGDLFDSNGVHIGIKQATADGLGGFSSAEDNESIANISQFSCAKFINSDDDIRLTFSTIAEHSIKTNNGENKKNKFQCAMAAAHFVYENGIYRGELANIGDTVILVLSSDYQLQNILKPHHIFRGLGTWAPVSVQMLLDEKNYGFLKCQTIDAQEGDVLISMSDGFLSDLPLNPYHINKEKTVREININDKKLQEILNSVSCPYPSAFEMGITLAKTALKNSLAKRKILLKLVNELTQLNANYELKTIDDAFTLLEQKGKKQIVKELHELLFTDNGMDGITYIKEKEIPFSYVLKDLKKRSMGDCSTINISRLPYHLDELIRSFLNNPQKQKSIADELKNNLVSISAIEKSIHRLSCEQELIEHEMSLNHCEMEMVFANKALEQAKSLLIHLFNLNQIIKNQNNYLSTLKLINQYFEANKIESPQSNHLVLLIKNDLKQTFKIKSFWENDNYFCYKEFCKKYGPAQVFRISNCDEETPTSEGFQRI